MYSLIVMEALLMGERATAFECSMGEYLEIVSSKDREENICMEMSNEALRKFRVGKGKLQTIMIEVT